jgi:hypothetical protein
MKNWKTTLTGLLAITLSAASAFFPVLIPIAGVVNGMIGIAAKDHDVTGGTRTQ